MKIVKSLLIFNQNLQTVSLMSCLVHAIHPIMSTKHLEGSLWDSNAYATLFVNYKNYLTARECKSKVVQEHFSETSKLSRAEARQIKPKQQANPRILFATTYNHMLPNMRSMIDWETPACLAFW